MHGRGAVAREQLAEPPRRDVVGGELREQIALTFRAPAHVGEQEVDLLAVGPGGREEAKGRDPDTLLVGVGRPRHVAARHGAADIGPVGQVNREGDELPFGEHRPHCLDVGQMISTHLWEVQKPHISLAEAFGRYSSQQLLHREAHDAHVDGDVTTLGDEPAFGVGQRGGEIARLLEERRARRPHHDHAHLLGDCIERVAHHLQGDGMDGYGVTSRMRFPKASPWQLFVDHSSSMRAGPSTLRPGPKAARR